MSDIFLVKHPWITDKSADASALGKYAFRVDPKATKPEIRKAIKEIYKVDVVAVNIINRPPKMKLFRGVAGARGAYKKAIVTLKEGQKIDLQ